MATWKLSPHPISDLRDWSTNGKLEIAPDYQRRAVWSLPAKILLIDTILKQLPIPKIFLASRLRNESTFRSVIDGQQRILAILGFINDEFKLVQPYTGDFVGKLFSQLPDEVKVSIFTYQIDFNEAFNIDDAEAREVFSRINKYNTPLNKQELRRADFPGAFASLAEELGNVELFDEFRIFTAANRKRSGDVEFVAELLTFQLEGIQEKKDILDSIYQKYSTMDITKTSELKSKFLGVMEAISEIFSDNFEISKTRFKQKSDFYTLFSVLFEILPNVKLKYNFENLREDLKILDELITPDSHVPVMREYAIICISQANSGSGRRYRHQFLKSILKGTFAPNEKDDDDKKTFYQIMDHIHLNGGGVCPDDKIYCAVCDEEVDDVDDSWVLGWEKNSTEKQISNATWIHQSCVTDDFIVISRANHE